MNAKKNRERDAFQNVTIAPAAKALGTLFLGLSLR